MGLGKKREAKRRSRPGLEALEGRAVPATFHVADVAQLRADLAAVSHSTAPTTLILAPGVYHVSNELRVQDAGNLTIRGTNAKNGATTQILGNTSDRVLEIDGGTVTLTNLTISGGGSVARGGGIEAINAKVTLNKATVSDNVATQTGGGIDVRGGALDLVSSFVADNAVNGSTHGNGGGIEAVNAQVTLSRTTVNNNAAFSPDPGPQGVVQEIGGGIDAHGGTLSISGSTISNNMATAATSGVSATGLGGAIASNGTVVSVSKSAINNNIIIALSKQARTAAGSAFDTVGGSLTIANSTTAGNTPGGKDEFVQSGGATVVLKNSTVNGQSFPGRYVLGDNGFKPQS